MLRRTQLPIRMRLTLWYLLLMALTFTIFGFFLFARLQRSLIYAIDASLQIAVAQTISTIDEDEPLAFEKAEIIQTTTSQLATTNFAMRIVDTQGTVQDIYGVMLDAPSWGPAAAGYSTQQDMATDGQWRSLSQPILASDGTLIGWVQAAQSMQYVNATLQDVRSQLLWGIPFIVLLAGLGGYFLANRALRPIKQITDTAQAISASDLSRRLAYQGPADEVGHLAHTFDQMLARLQGAFEHERRFLGDAAHELRTPLTVLKGQIEVTLSRPRTCAEYAHKLQELAAHVERLIRLSNALCFISVSDQNRHSWEPAVLNLGELLGVIVEQVRPLAQEKSLALQAQLPPQLPVYGDMDHLVRLFLNLLDNAVKYTPPGGQINVVAAHAASGAQVVLQNSGPMIAPEHLPQLFERFYRVDSDRSSATGGSGLGLAIAHDIVRLHGGTIHVQSESGQGTTFTVILPDQR